jgi:ABC-type multidrug transport system ATPase subunit
MMICSVWLSGSQVSGEVTYNGYGLDEFVPQKTAAYISQNDVHAGEMTVKETLDFSARCQGVGQRYGEQSWLDDMFGVSD